jgi:hypothetical protein
MGLGGVDGIWTSGEAVTVRLSDYQGINDPKQPLSKLSDFEKDELLAQSARAIVRLAEAQKAALENAERRQMEEEARERAKRKADAEEARRQAKRHAEAVEKARQQDKREAQTEEEAKQQAERDSKTEGRVTRAQESQLSAFSPEAFYRWVGVGQGTGSSTRDIVS